MRSKRSKAWHRRKQARAITRTILGIARQCAYTRRDGRYWRHCQKREGHLGPHVDHEGVEFAGGIRAAYDRSFEHHDNLITCSTKFTIKVIDATS